MNALLPKLPSEFLVCYFFTNFHVSIVFLLSVIFFMFPVSPVIKVYRNPAGLQKRTTQFIISFIQRSIPCYKHIITAQTAVGHVIVALNELFRPCVTQHSPQLKNTEIIRVIRAKWNLVTDQWSHIDLPFRDPSGVEAMQNQASPSSATHWWCGRRLFLWSPFKKTHT